MSYRLEKFASTLRQALGEILGRESLNPEFKFVTVMRVLPTPDLKRASVFIACPDDHVAGALEQLQGSRGFIKKQLAHKMILRYMPELDFALDATAMLESRLDKLNPKKDFPGESRAHSAGGEARRQDEEDDEAADR